MFLTHTSDRKKDLTLNAAYMSNQRVSREISAHRMMIMLSHVRLVVLQAYLLLRCMMMYMNSNFCKKNHTNLVFLPCKCNRLNSMCNETAEFITLVLPD